MGKETQCRAEEHPNAPLAAEHMSTVEAEMQLRDAEHAARHIRRRKFNSTQSVRSVIDVM